MSYIYLLANNPSDCCYTIFRREPYPGCRLNNEKLMELLNWTRMPALFKNFQFFEEIRTVNNLPHARLFGNWLNPRLFSDDQEMTQHLAPFAQELIQDYLLYLISCIDLLLVKSVFEDDLSSFIGKECAEFIAALKKVMNIWQLPYHPFNMDDESGDPLRFVSWKNVSSMGYDAHSEVRDLMKKHGL